MSCKRAVYFVPRGDLREAVESGFESVGTYHRSVAGQGEGGEPQLLLEVQLATGVKWFVMKPKSHQYCQLVSTPRLERLPKACSPDVAPHPLVCRICTLGEDTIPTRFCTPHAATSAPSAVPRRAVVDGALWVVAGREGHGCGLRRPAQHNQAASTPGTSRATPRTVCRGSGW